jgi:hypothetical protein
MLVWMLIGVGIAVVFAVLIIRNAEADDKQRKLTKRPVSNSY